MIRVNCIDELNNVSNGKQIIKIHYDNNEVREKFTLAIYSVNLSMPDDFLPSICSMNTFIIFLKFWGFDVDLIESKRDYRLIRHEYLKKTYSDYILV